VAELTDANSTEVSPEQVMLWQPDVLLLSKEMGFFDQIYEDKTWASIKAVREKQVYEVPYQPYEWLDRPPSVQTVLGLQWVGNLLAPDIYDFDMVEKAREFYELFWSYELTEENITELLGNSTLL
jgi:iron complex transport system substrate-binding protein